MFIAALFTIAKTWKQHKCPSKDDWIRKTWYIYTMEYYSVMKKSKIMSFAATWMELLILSEVRKTKTNTIWYHLYLESNIGHKWTFSTEKKLMNLGNRPVADKGEGVGWIGSLGLTDANYCLWNGLAMRSCCIALELYLVTYIKHDGG